MVDEIHLPKLYPLLSAGKIRPVKERQPTMQQRRFAQDLHEEEGERGEAREEEDKPERKEMNRVAGAPEEERSGNAHGSTAGTHAPDADQEKRIDILV
jgi:hypothetical protein